MTKKTADGLCEEVERRAKWGTQPCADVHLHRSHPNETAPILIEGTKFKAVGAGLSIPAGAQVIDLSGLVVLPGLVDTHNHLAITYKVEPENNQYYFIVRDMGNNGNYADTALRQAIEQGWIPGPQLINSGIIIGGLGGQYWPTPEMGVGKHIVYPEYLAADLIAVPGNPLEKIDALRDVQFVMKNGVVFKQNGVMTPEKFFHGGPVNGWRIR